MLFEFHAPTENKLKFWNKKQNDEKSFDKKKKKTDPRKTVCK